MGALIDAVLFDAGGVLVVPDPAALAPVCRRFGADPRPEDVVRAHYAGMRAQDAQATEHDDWRPLPGARGRWPAACAPDDAVPAAVALGTRCGRRTSGATRWPPRCRRCSTCSGEACRSVWCPTPRARSKAVLAAQGVCQVGAGAGVPVQVVVDSEVVGVMKPDPAIFALGPRGARPAARPGRLRGRLGAQRRARAPRPPACVPLHLDPLRRPHPRPSMRGSRRSMTSSAGGDRPAPGSEVSDRWAGWRREVDLEEYAAAGSAWRRRADGPWRGGPGRVARTGAGARCRVRRPDGSPSSWRGAASMSPVSTSTRTCSASLAARPRISCGWRPTSPRCASTAASP